MLPSPAPTSARFVGASSARPRPPFGIDSFREDGEAWVFALADDDVARVAGALPDPSTLADGTLVVLLPEAGAPRGVWSIFSAGKSVPRSVRCGALLLRGYVDLGACVDPQSKLDLVWGRARR